MTFLRGLHYLCRSSSAERPCLSAVDGRIHIARILAHHQSKRVDANGAAVMTRVREAAAMTLFFRLPSPSPQLYSYPNRLGMIGEVAPSLPAPRTEGQLIMKPSEEGVAHSTGRSRTSRLPAAPSPLPENQFYRRKEGRR